MNTTIKIFTFILFALFISSCARQTRKVSYSVKTGNSYKKGKSPKTGMVYNDESNGGFMVNTKFKRVTPPGLVPIEGGTFVMGASADNTMSYTNKLTKKRVTVASFYIDETAVSNRDYLEYLHWIKTNYPEDGRRYYEALPDTTVWDRTSTANSQYSKIYLRHPAFQDYPVVGVSWNQANDYCVWRTDRVNENILREKGIIADWKTYRSNSGDQVKPFTTEDYLMGNYRGEGIDGEKMPQNYAVNAEPNSKRTVGIEDGMLIQPYRLPTEAEWEYAATALLANNEGYLNQGKIDYRSDKRSTRGLIMMNYKMGKGNNMGTAGYLNDGADITAPVRAYEPNAFGLFNMLGNVNEWVADIYQENTYNPSNDLSPIVGASNLDNVDEMVESQKLSYDDYISRVNTQESPMDNKNIDTLDAALYGVSTLINADSRVIKGGSWNDRIHWLNPSARRHFNEKSSSAIIGFRCAMTMTGSPEVVSNNMKRASKKRKNIKRNK